MASLTGIEQLDAMIATMRRLAEPEQYRQAAKRAVETHLRAEIEAGRDPQTGAAWAPRKDGGRALAGAKALAVRLSGSQIIAELSGHRVLHHFGAGRGGVRRGQLPTQGMPAKLGQAIRAGLVEPFRKALRG